MHSRTGFSLVEVVIAIGIFGFAAVTILGLLGGLLTSSRESWQDTRAAQIARQILIDLQPLPGTTTGYLIAGENAEGKTPVELAASSGITLSAWYCMEGSPIGESDPQTTFAATIELQPLPGRSNLHQVRIDIRPTAAPPDIKPFRFVSRISPRALEL